MTLTKTCIMILLIIAIMAFVLGRLALRTILNLLLGGTLFGGNFLWDKKREAAKCLYLYA